MTEFNQDDKVVVETESASKNQNGTVYLVLGWVFAVASILFLPILLGPLAIFFGHLTQKNGLEKQGKILMIAAAVLMVIGFALGFLTYMLLRG